MRKNRSEAKAFGQIIRQLREARGLSLREVASRTGISHPTWSRGERGTIDLRNWNYVVSLAMALDVPLDDLTRRAGLKPLLTLRELAEAEEDGSTRGRVESVTAGSPRGDTLRFRADTASLLRLSPVLPSFLTTMRRLMDESLKADDLTPLREVTAYAEGLLRSRVDSKR